MHPLLTPESAKKLLIHEREQTITLAETNLIMNYLVNPLEGTP